MKDIFGNDLEIGDTVAFNPPIYKGLVKGTVLKFSRKTIRIGYKPHGKQYTEECSVYPSDLVKKV